ncbi:hypothetical protein GQ53DRAFT_473106 [Thozetella sp. PMI_491]|nr:hypothetical protein GQ53DRAFT_473106 [Thozetella sp. PMI_491]
MDASIPSRRRFLEPLPLELTLEIFQLVATDRPSILSTRLTCRSFNAVMSPITFRYMGRMADTVAANYNQTHLLGRSKVLESIELDDAFLSALYWGLQNHKPVLKGPSPELTESNFARLAGRMDLEAKEILRGIKFYLTIGRGHRWVNSSYLHEGAVSLGCDQRGC